MQTFEAITSRQGVLRYKPDPVDPEKIAQVLKAAIAAPNPANTHPWEFVVVTAPDLTRKIADYLMEAQYKFVFRRLIQIDEDFRHHLMKHYDAFRATPCFIVVCRSLRVDLGAGEYDEILRDWDLLCLGAAMANLMTMATALGLGTRWFGGFLMDAGGMGLKAMLEIPDVVEVVGVTPLGFHEEPAKHRPVQSLEVLTNFKRGEKHSRLCNPSSVNSSGPSSPGRYSDKFYQSPSSH